MTGSGLKLLNFLGCQTLWLPGEVLCPIPTPGLLESMATQVCSLNPASSEGGGDPNGR